MYNLAAIGFVSAEIPIFFLYKNFAIANKYRLTNKFPKKEKLVNFLEDGKIKPSNIINIPMIHLIQCN